MGDMTTIKISYTLKKELDSLKIENETYNTIIKRIVIENNNLRAEKEKLFNILENINK